MDHIPYPSTRNFLNFKTDYIRTLDPQHLTPVHSDSESLSPPPSSPPQKMPPSKATFFGTVKLHGTNATVVFHNNDKRHPQIQARSWIIESTKKDNMGTYTLLSAAPLSSLVDQILAVRGQSSFSEIYICGEIAGRGVQKGVAITAMERFFAIFNIRIDGYWCDMRDYKSCSLPKHRIYNVAQYKTFQVDIDFRVDTAATFELMKKYTAEVYEECPFGSAFADPATRLKFTGRGEGIVWTMVPSSFMDEGVEFDDTVLYNFKTKGEQFTATSRAPREHKESDSGMVAAAVEFADFALGERRFEQGIEYLEGEQARTDKPIRGYDIKLTGMFIKWVVEDAMKEEENERVKLGVGEKEAKKELGARAKEWYVRRCVEVANGLTAG
ncbi:hypothetical protein B0H10DRAFT_1143498 [Mycena sp. CBHHK59/15]|nr:hypothetical protein B0H10DRAFT_1143498 [Mycena sp. CBHHK59/15]